MVARVLGTISPQYRKQCVSFMYTNTSVNNIVLKINISKNVWPHYEATLFQGGCYPWMLSTAGIFELQGDSLIENLMRLCV